MTACTMIMTVRIFCIPAHQMDLIFIQAAWTIHGCLPKAANWKRESGLSQVKSDNDFRFYFNNGSLVPDPLRSNHFTYDEKIAAAYVNFNTNIGKKTSVQTGLRMEHTQSVGHLLTTGQKTNREYTDFFPSVFVQQKLHEDLYVTGSYSRRINRPNYGNLNPFSLTGTLILIGKATLPETTIFPLV